VPRLAKPARQPGPRAANLRQPCDGMAAGRAV